VYPADRTGEFEDAEEGMAPFTFIKGRRLILLLAIFSAIFLSGAVFRHPASTHLRAMSVLLRYSNPQSTGFGVRFAQHPFKEKLGSVQTEWGPLKYRVYVPQDVRHVHGLVLVPGVHHLGMEHPSLVGLARALAGAGVEVMTPELRDLADYRVTPQSADLIGVSAQVLCAQLRQPKVGVMGLSFAGGLALLAASKPVYADQIEFVLAVGAHDDLVRVSRFFVTNTIERPDGSVAAFQAHEYGALVMVYSHLEDFFPAADIPAAREALRLWLWEEQDAALAAARRLSPQGQAEFDELLHHRDRLQQQLLREIKLYSPEMEAVSPHGQLRGLRVPVYLLHGAGDTVIPPSETLWLSQEVPRKELQATLISPALIHVAVEDTVSLAEKWALVDFLAQVLDKTDKLGS